MVFIPTCISQQVRKTTGLGDILSSTAFRCRSVLIKKSPGFAGERFSLSKIVNRDHFYILSLRFNQLLIRIPEDIQMAPGFYGITRGHSYENGDRQEEPVKNIFADASLLKKI